MPTNLLAILPELILTHKTKSRSSKGHGFSRANNFHLKNRALAPEVRQFITLAAPKEAR